MTEKLTNYKFEVDTGEEVIIQELKVPFTHEEIEILESLEEIKNSWSKRASQGSGLVRELYLGLVNVPLGWALVDRNSALKLIRLTIENINIVKESGDLEYTLVAEDLTRIENGLTPFIPSSKE